MKNTLIVAIFFLAFAACQPNETSQRTTVAANATNESLVKQYFDYFNKHDWQQMAAMYSDTAEFKDPSLGEGIVKQTHEQIVKKYGELQQMIPDVRDSVVTIYPSGDKHMIVEFISTGTTPDKSKFALPICTIFTIENGRITQDFTYYDNFSE
ncbi:ketosteroid isomerase-like protein [Dyadobacter sp. BE34]|uniref:Ketosteroid isomerase-like protein n=1 Tax=Dyadobacter fermentans TaxID=94254 RepID=A0ABU1QXQ6_9BACT|nr:MULTISPECIES: nuclear transport factor 2 family protein [Dyadobacter]MDR6805449.1 ketosteroid isomerase-like protein [Dyadobacter fermentans]MDR7042791.1 ketosteroid isomerase-like protein [Dyadobacter sp. BE242]MDR7197103.1 ketosteroid isomerase-like protein [Dyadobacter sp. BE34]MDR7215462.1 ketosteroid isomerase-like protein [Dyadobacter sp. BE31]MDR7262998.1 ketosteroid isomerase-like protein [Dyadobacter sp. BE32]